MQGLFKVEHWRAGRLIGYYEFPNGVTTAGKNKILDVMFHAVTQINPWYIGLIDNVGWVAEVSGDILASHSGWTEFVGYTGNRKEWTEDAAAAQSITNTTLVEFAITANGVLKGIMVCSAATGGSGTLWATASFPSVVSVSIGDTFKIIYTINT